MFGIYCSSRSLAKMGKKSRDKGHAYERHVARLMQEAGYPNARRNIQSQGGETVGGDIVQVPWAVECNRPKRVYWSALVKKLVQAYRDEAATGGQRPKVVVFRPDGDTNDYVLTKLDDWLEVTHDAIEQGQQEGVGERGEAERLARRMAGRHVASTLKHQGDRRTP